jgi:hypothetical protein
MVAMSSSDPVTRVRNDALEKFRLEVAPETEAIKSALAAEERGLQAAIIGALKSGEVLSRVRDRAPLWPLAALSQSRVSLGDGCDGEAKHAPF